MHHMLIITIVGILHSRLAQDHIQRTEELISSLRTGEAGDRKAAEAIEEL